VHPASDVAGDERLIGTIVHRLFQRRVDPSQSETTLRAIAIQLAPSDQGDSMAAQTQAARSAARLYRDFARRADVAELIGAGSCHYEVPFFFDDPDRPGERLRGLIDCLVIQADGRATDVEFKTGRPRPEHEAQAARYARAVEAALGVGPVGTRILYP
jgi:CRISPR/Cas system-associated exonuclease Cas4 (RecB family)